MERSGTGHLLAAGGAVAMIRVLVVDDHPLVRLGLSALLRTAADIEVVAEAADGVQAIERVRSSKPDVVLMDLSMPVLDGVAATSAILAEFAQVRVIVLSSASERDKVREAIAAGAIGYLLKDCHPQELLSAIRSAAQGYSPLDPRVAGALLRRAEPSTARPPSAPGLSRQLSNRERQVLRLTSRGLANKQIARELGITERTVKVHLGNVFRCIGVGDRTSAAMWARDHLPDED
ncbi:MAG: two component transcriptional regulator, LuxR family [Frankiales bacterium]|nr:two component transcriptional regulator, LuxR family [Frankiales bacterium]